MIGRRALLGVAVALLALAATACQRTPAGAGDHSLGRLEIIDRGQTAQPVVATWVRGQGWSGSLPEIRLSSSPGRVSLGARVHSDAGIERPLSGEYSIRWSLAPNAPAAVVVSDDSRGERFHGDYVDIYGAAPGTTQIQFLLWHLTHDDGATDPVDVRVVE